MSNYLKSLTRLLLSESTPKLGLSRIEALLLELGNPERKFASIHVAGTNGKGSTCAFLASLLSQSKASVGLYTSPHLLCARERIQVNGELVSEDLFCDAESAVFDASERIGERPTFFERITAMAFWVFAAQKVDIAIVEVGLGGRLDATNVLLPLASVITRIDLDHAEILGDTIERIAREKAGIIKPKTPVITGWQKQTAQEVISSTAESLRAPLTVVSTPCTYEISLEGDHQKRNAALALEALSAAGISLSAVQAQNGLSSTRWPGRLELVQRNPDILIDGAHNPAGVRALVKTLLENPKYKDQPIFLVIGLTHGHNAEEMVEALMPLKSRLIEIIATRSKSPRAVLPLPLSQILKRGVPCVVTENISDALTQVHSRIFGSNAMTVVTGSLYVAGEARSLFFQMPTDPTLPNF